MWKILGRLVVVGILLVSVPAWAASKSAAKKTAKPAAKSEVKPAPKPESSALQRVGDPFMGDWTGQWTTGGRKDTPVYAQVIALGHGMYQINLLNALDRHVAPLAILNGNAGKDGIDFAGNTGGTPWAVSVRQSEITGLAGKRDTFSLQHVARLSPTFNAKAPEGAVVLFDGRNLDAFTASDPAVKPETGETPCPWLLSKNGALEVRGGGIVSKRKFMDHKLHVEFRIPFMPEARAQDRGNSGVYLQGRYEVQILDSYGLWGRDNECGGIYKVAAPRVNMCAPPLQWQTYDITFRAARFDADGKKTEDARITVLHNGVMIHENVSVPGPTTAAVVETETAEPGPLHLQDHGTPVQFRNIWVVEGAE
jgi:hypothetical protein